MTATLAAKTPIIYAPIASSGHYRGTVLSGRADGTVDIELSKEDSGQGDHVTLRCIVVVDSLADLKPGTCTVEPSWRKI